MQGRVWRNVTVNGQTVIAAGAPMVLKISSITKRKIAKLTLCDRAWVSAAKVTQVNEKDIPALQLEVGPPAASGQCNSAHAYGRHEGALEPLREGHQPLHGFGGSRVC